MRSEEPPEVHENTQDKFEAERKSTLQTQFLFPETDFLNEASTLSHTPFKMVLQYCAVYKVPAESNRVEQAICTSVAVERVKATPKPTMPLFNKTLFEITAVLAEADALQATPFRRTPSVFCAC